MSEFEQDPSANTGRFRAFVQQAEPDTAERTGPSRGMLIGGAIVAVIVVIVLLVALV